MFSNRVYGLTKLPNTTGGDGSGDNSTYFLGLEVNATQTCPNYAGQPVTCEANATVITNFEAVVEEVAFNHGGDYFAVALTIFGPYLRGATCGESIAPGDSPCDSGPSNYDVIIGRSWMRREEHTGNRLDVSPTFDASSEDPYGSSWSFENWPRPLSESTDPGVAYLVNPSPVWPIPDSNGNEFGHCLFTLAQLPVSIPIQIIHTNHYVGPTGYAILSIIVYNEGMTIPEPGEAKCIIHYA